MKQGERFLRLEPDKYLAVKYGWVLRGITFSIVEGKWRMIVKITDDKGNGRVAFIVCSDISECWTYLYEHFTTTAAPLRWGVDKYYVK